MFDKLIPWKKQNNELSNYRNHRRFSDLYNDFDALWDRFADDWRSGSLPGWQDFGLTRRVDFDEEDNQYVLRAELPGYEPDEIDVKVSGNTLTLRAEHNEQGKSKSGKGSYQRYGSFYESMTLPAAVDTDQIDARYHSGVLEVHLPKDAERMGKRIEVKAH